MKRDLETNLLELGLIDESLLSACAAAAAELPVLPLEMLEHPEPEAVRLVPWAVVDEYRILPLRMVDGNLVIGVSKPLDAGKLRDLGFLLGVTFSPHYMLDFRLAMGLQNLFGIPMNRRQTALQKRLAPDYVRSDSPLVVPAFIAFAKFIRAYVLTVGTFVVPLFTMNSDNSFPVASIPETMCVTAAPVDVAPTIR